MIIAILLLRYKVEILFIAPIIASMELIFDFSLYNIKTFNRYIIFKMF